MSKAKYRYDYLKAETQTANYTEQLVAKLVYCLNEEAKNGWEPFGEPIFTTREAFILVRKREDQPIPEWPQGPGEAL